MKNKILIIAGLVFLSLFILTQCNKDDDNDNSVIKDFLGSYDADMTVTSISGTNSEQYILFIEEPTNNTEDEISIRNIADDGNTHSAKVVGKDFVINKNPDYLTGTGTLQSDNQTIQFEYTIENQESGTGTLTKR
ncbi:MAG: hypothetical protein WD048_08310 [Chitinophagales bacterium]